MKIGIITYVKCDNYGAELQAFALQWKLNQMGYDAEVVNLEKREIDLKKNPGVIYRSVKQRIKQQGFKAVKSIFLKVKDTLTKLHAQTDCKVMIEKKHLLFENFFEQKIRHSARFYTLDEISKIDTLPYDILVAGSDQIWNYIHTDRLDVYFLMFANKLGIKKISYAASISINDIPKRLRKDYCKYLNNIDCLSVRELDGAAMIKRYWNMNAEVVLDPTLLITKEEWINNVAVEPAIKDKYLLIYTLSGSPHIRNLAWNIANKLGLKVVNIKSNFVEEEPDGTIHYYEVGPAEWVGLWSKASYVVTDSFHGTAFSINFNIPFTTLVNPVSTMNSRVLSILPIIQLTSRIAYDNVDRIDESEELDVDFGFANDIINLWRQKSLRFINKSLN